MLITLIHRLPAIPRSGERQKRGPTKATPPAWPWHFLPLLTMNTRLRLLQTPLASEFNLSWSLLLI
jgi:hypothetical protein